MTCFEYGIAARGDNFYDRQEEIRAVQAHGRVWICGQRRMGKSSLLLRVGEELRNQNWLALEYDVARIRPGDARGETLFQSFFKKHYQTTLRQEGFRRDQFDACAPEKAFGELIERLIDSGKKVAFLWDEAERLINVNQNDPEFFDAFRAHLGQSKDFKMIIAGTQRLSKLYPDNEEVSSFISTFKYIPLKGLDDSAARSLLNCEQTGGWASRLPEKIVENVIGWCGGHPLLLQELGDKLAKATNWVGSGASEETLNHCMQSIISNEGLRKIFANDQRLLTSPQQAILRTICGTGSAQTVEDLASATGYDSTQVRLAVSFLENFGYINWKDSILPRFRFYPDFLLPSRDESFTDERKVALIEQSFDVFLSHNSQDKPTVRKLANALKSRGLKVWLDEWELIPGRRWQDALEQIIKTTRSAAVLVGKDGLGPWEHQEMQALLSEFVKRGLPIIPVLLPSAGKQPELPIFLKLYKWVDLRSGLNDENLDILQWGVTGVKPDSCS